MDFLCDRELGSPCLDTGPDLLIHPHRPEIWGGGGFIILPGLDSLDCLPSDLMLIKEEEGVPEMGTKPLKALRGYRASNRGSKKP